MNQSLLPALSEYLLSYRTELENELENAAQLAAKSTSDGGLIHLAAGDMSSGGIFEVFMKPGCLCTFSPVTDPTLSTLHGAYRSFLLKDTSRIGTFLYQYYRNIHPGDTILIADLLGSPAAYELLCCAKKDKVSTIWITSRQEALKEADVTLPFSAPADSNGLYGSVLLSAIGYEINHRAIRILQEANLPFDTWKPYDVSCKQENIHLCETYRNRIKQL